MLVSRMVEVLEERMTVTLKGPGDLRITGLAYHSARVTPGSLFAALPGSRSEGGFYSAEAVKRGAAAILHPMPSARGLDDLPSGMALLGVEDVRLALAIVADAFFDHPSRGMTMVGVTGTNGKTTLTYLTEGMARAGGLECGVVGTIAYRLGSREAPADRTTPEAPDLQGILRWMADDGAGMVVMEVSSHALDQKRVDGTRFDYALFTNLSLDHLDYHGDMESYYQAKKKLFTDFGVEAAVINLDDPYGRRLAEEIDGEVVTFGIREECHIRPRETVSGPEGLKMDIEVPGGTLSLASPLLGEHNAENLLAAAALGWRMGLPAGAIQEGAASVEAVPGRFQKVSSAGGPLVLVDYAHTPEALESLLKSARKMTRGRLIVVFGCGGDRDRSKRPIMGRIAAEKADFSLITSDNPRTEPPDMIIEAIREGYLKAREDGFKAVMDRREAIGLAAEMARPADTVVIAGKGHEDYQIFGEVKIHFDDREAAREAFRRVRL